MAGQQESPWLQNGSLRPLVFRPAAGAAIGSPAPDDLTSSSARLAAALLIVAGLFQWTPWKQACLRRCPGLLLGFLAASWRESRFGAVKMGAHHGFYCLGCCWAVMAPLFGARRHELAVSGALSAFVRVEKIAPKFLSRGGGLAMIAAGATSLAP